MDSNRRVRAAAFAVWAALLVLLAAAILRTTDLGATLAKALTPAPTATTAPPTPTPVPLHTYHIPISIGQYGDLIAWPYGPLWLRYSGGLERIDVQGNNLFRSRRLLLPAAHRLRTQVTSLKRLFTKYLPAGSRMATSVAPRSPLPRPRKTSGHIGARRKQK